jgi:DNA-binding GntR family transcriptional regulator
MPTAADKKIGRPKGTGSQRIYDALRKRILSLQMLPGANIDENSLVNEFGVSRTPVREALIHLATDGLVTLQANRGASVSPLDIDEIPEMLEGLELCLRVTTRWAAVRRTDNNAFHMAIAESAGNRHVTNLYKYLLPGFYRLSHSLLSSAKLSSFSYKGYFARVSDEHQSIIAAIVSRDADAADEMARNHAKLICERIMSCVQSSLAGEIILDTTGK